MPSDAAAPPTGVMNSRRFIASSEAQAEVILPPQTSRLEGGRMSPSGHSLPNWAAPTMSELTPRQSPLCPDSLRVFA